jgi:hypothetical protein
MLTRTNLGEPAFFNPSNKLVKVAEISVKDVDYERFFDVTCFTVSETLFIDGRFAPAGITAIGTSLNWFLGEIVGDIDIEELYFENTAHPMGRPAHAWEKRSFLHGHWKQYAKNNIRIRLVLRFGDEENESIYWKEQE